MEKMKLAKIRAKRQFKALVHLVIANLEWLSEDEPSIKPGGRNIHYMKSTKRTLKSILKLKDKALLNKPAELRTEEEKNWLYRILGGLSCFRKYPPHVQLLLAGSAYYQYFGPERTIVRQNHRAEALYFIITGEVNALIDEYDPVFNETVTTITDVLVPGNSFGEISLLNDIPRLNTIVTKTSVEFVVLKREDFDIILKESVKKEWDYITACLNTFTYFEFWDDMTKTDCCMVSRIRKFVRNQTILGDNTGMKGWVHFVLKGKCVLIEDIMVNEIVRGNQSYYKLRPGRLQAESTTQQNLYAPSMAEMIKMSKSQDIRTMSKHSSIYRIDSLQAATGTSKLHFMQVCIFSQKACFGLGENMLRRRIIAEGDVEILAIPLYWLKFKGKTSRTWVRIVEFLHRSIPDTNQLFKEFVEQRKWRKCKKDMIRAEVHKLPCLVPSSIPYSVRINDDFEYIESLL